MEWVINFIWDYFKCKECDKYKLREQELLCLVEQLEFNNSMVPSIVVALHRTLKRGGFP